MYRARWVCPETGRPKERTFHGKAKAVAFQSLPRDHLVFIEPYREPRDDRPRQG